MSTVRCIAKVKRSSFHAESMIDNGQMISTRLILPWFIKKSADQIALAVLPVPCSLKQNARLLRVRKEEVVF